MKTKSQSSTEIPAQMNSYKNEKYMQITKDGKAHLLSHHSDKRFDLPKGREGINTVGDFFYLTKSVKKTSMSVKDKKTGLWQPPKALGMHNEFNFYKNPSDAVPVTIISANEMFLLWKEKNYNSRFDYTAFTTENQIKIYDNNLKLLKTIPKPKKEHIDIDELASKALGEDISQRYPSVNMTEAELIEYPLMKVSRRDSQNQVFIERTYNDNDPIFLFTTGCGVSGSRNTITLSKENEVFAQFDVDLKTGKIYYPKVYLDQLGLDFAQKVDTTIYQNMIPSAGYAGGQRAMLNFIKDNLVYPREVKRGKVEGKVVAKFVVEKDGSISNIGIVKSLSKECDAEVISIIKKMPSWLPAKKDEHAVRSYYRLPITFTADK
ncbi:MAG: energy transducer TonB [Chryseobacterium sp.]|nr:MAG: energy transducer TonB [Chryseobacterium sp.]